MTGTNLAAAAADVELTADGDIDFDKLIAEAATPDPMIARDALLRLAKAITEAEEVAALRAQIVDRYDQRLQQLQSAAAEERRIVEAYVKRFGKVSFPDAGGAHLTTKCKGGSVKVADVVALEAWMDEQGIAEIPYKPAAVDVAAALDLVRKTMKVHATPDGHLVNHETGEKVEIPGIVVEPETKTLAVRKP